MPPGAPLWLLYELDEEVDAVVRTVWLFPDGTVTRNSIEIEERTGKACPSLFDTSLAEGFENVELEPITLKQFEEAWIRGIDTPFWYVA